MLVLLHCNPKACDLGMASTTAKVNGNLST